MLFSAQIKFINEIEKNVFQILQSTIGQFDYVLKDFITNKQLFRQGIDGEGKKLPGYARTTIRIKLSKGQPVDRTTTVDEGDFHASIEIKEFTDRFEVSSNVSYDKFIIKRYGQDILKITNENFTEFLIVYFLPNLRTFAKNKFRR